MGRLAGEWGLCSETDSWLSGPSKSPAPVGAMTLRGCGGRVLREWPVLQLLLMRLRVCLKGWLSEPSNKEFEGSQVKSAYAVQTVVS